MLAKTILQPANILFLDEPTNHLDMQSADSLLGAVDDFDGSMVMVTHNEMFLRAVADRLIVFRNDNVEVFEGSYEDFLNKVGWDENETVKNEGPTNSINKKELRRMRSEVISEKNKVLKPLQDKITKLEKEIEDAEMNVEEMNNLLVEASTKGDAEEIARLSKSLDESKSIAENGFDELLELTEELDEKTKVYEAKLEELG
jgi:ATP-binding cassette subfamily F protein 3